MSTFELHFGPKIFEKALGCERTESEPSQEPLESSSGKLDELTDTELVYRIRDTSSPECMAVLFTRYRPVILSICVNILRDRFEAEDVCQDVILEIWSKANQFDEKRGTVKVWIVQLAYSKSLHRRRYLATRHFADCSKNGNVDGSRNERSQSSYQPEHVERLAMEQQVLDMVTAFSSLPPKQQKTLQLIYFAGLSIREVAQQTNESVENTRNHYYRGLKKLKEILSGSSVERVR